MTVLDFLKRSAEKSAEVKQTARQKYLCLIVKAAKQKSLSSADQKQMDSAMQEIGLSLPDAERDVRICGKISELRAHVATKEQTRAAHRAAEAALRTAKKKTEAALAEEKTAFLQNVETFADVKRVIDSGIELQKYQAGSPDFFAEVARG